MEKDEKIKELQTKIDECLNNQEYEKALEIIDELLELDASNIVSHINKSNILCILGKNEEALNCFEEIIKLDPNHRDAYFNKGNILAELKQYDEAIKAYDMAIKIDPSDSDAYANKGATLNGLQKYSEALKCLNTAIKLNPKNVYAYLNKGVTLSSLGKNEEALECINKAIELDTNNNRACVAKGTILNSLERYEEALECYNKSIGLDPNDSITYFNKGFVLHKLEKHKEALECLDTAIDLDPKNSSFYYNKGIMLAIANEYNEAIKSYDKSIELDTANSDAYHNKGALLHRLSKYDEALKLYNKAMQLDPSKTNAYLNKIMLLREPKRVSLVKESFAIIKKEINETLSALIKNTDNILYQLYFMLIILYEEKYIEKDDLSSILQKIITKQPNDNIACKSLYSYVPFNKETIDSIVHEYKYAQQIFNFNDPTDPTIRLIKTDDDQKQMKSMFEKIRIACFSTDPCNMLLYSHYTNSHKGICIEYDFKNFNGDNQALLKMDYKEGIKIDENTLQIIALLSTNDKKQITSFLDLFRTKQTCWKYEKEYRVITYDVKKIMLPIKAIYFGKEMEDHDIKLIMKLFTNKKSNINFWKVQVAKDNLFKLYAVGDILPIPIFPEKVLTHKTDND